MPSDRAGYTVCVFAIDVSPSMADIHPDPDDPEDAKVKGKKRTKLDLAKEYVARVLEPKISSGRKTEAVGILSFGGRTNNQANHAYTVKNPDDDDAPYANISADVAIQTAKPKTVEEVMNLEIGEVGGEPVSALMVALDMIHVHKHSKSWSLEVVLVTDGESDIDQTEFEACSTRFEEMGVKFTIVGIGFQIPPTPVDKSKTRNKRLAEKFWRVFFQQLHEEVSKTTTSEELIPDYLSLDNELTRARLPKPVTVNGTLAGIDLFIGSADVHPDEAIQFPVKYSKATMRARPPTLAKAWKPAMDLQAPLQPNAPMSQMSSSGKMLSEFAAEISQERTGGVPSQMGGLASMVSSEVKLYHTYVIKKPEPEMPEATGKEDRQPSQAQKKGGMEVEEEEGEQEEEEVEKGEEAEEEHEESVEKEDIVRAWRFGSTWVPMEKDTFEPLNTKKGVEVLGFFPRANLKRHHLMGEVRFVWPDLSSPKGQIQFSSFVTALILREMVAVVRWVVKDQSDPVIGICIPEQDFPDAGKRLDFMFWIKLPFAEDEHTFWFGSLETYKTATGKVLKEHPLLPTEEQCDLMEQFVVSMDLDEYAAGKVKKEEKEEEDEDMEPQDDFVVPWFEALSSYNPAIHRIKEAIFHASLTYDLDADPLGPPHPELIKYFNSPDVLVEQSAGVVEKLKESLAIKKVPMKVRLAKRQKEGLREGEGYIDIDDLFDEEKEESKAATWQKPATPKKSQPTPHPVDGDDDEEVMPPPPAPSKKTTTPAKPKRGRLVSNEAPLDDFHRLINGEGDVFRKAIQDLGAVVKENIEASFSHQAFPLALDCLKAMRETALMYEEADTYNAFIKDLEKFINEPKFKHKDFWKSFEKAGKNVSHITPEEEEAALNGDEE